MKIKFKNKVYHDELNKFVNQGIKHPLVLEEISSIENGGDRNPKVEVFCNALFNQKEYAQMLVDYYKDQELYEMFMRCKVYNEDVYLEIFNSFNNEQAIQFFQTANASTPFTIINKAFTEFKISYNEIFANLENKVFSENLRTELRKMEPDNEVIFKELKDSSKKSFATIFDMCQKAGSEEEASLYVERVINVISQHEEKHRYFFILKKMIIVLLDAKIAPGLYDKYKLLFN